MNAPSTSRRTTAGRILGPSRVLAFWILFFGLLVYCCLYIGATILLPARLSSRWRDRRERRRWNLFLHWGPAAVVALLRGVGGLRLHITGDVPQGRFLVVSNHQSAIDIMVLFVALRKLNLKFVAKHDLRRGIPAISVALRRGGACVVDPRSPRAAMVELRRFARSLAVWEGSPLIFPEGIRSFDGSLTPFRESGLRLLAREAGLPVLPVVLDGLWPARTIGQLFTHLPGMRARVGILPPFEPGTDREALDALAGRLEALIKGELVRMRSRGGPGGRPDPGESRNGEPPGKG